MFKQLRTATVLLVAMTVLTGIIYPLVVTAIAQIAFNHKASGSLIVEGDRTVGSNLIGQEFTRPEFFWGRLSATGPVPYNAAASSGSNLGPMNPARKAAAEARIEALRAAGSPAENVPIDLVTASASGLDPHISPAAAEFQIARVAKARNMTEDQVRELVSAHTEMPQFGMLGEPRVNVLQLNLAVQRAAMP
jgi:K+-transporting ATPase ATPase C chain